MLAFAKGALLAVLAAICASSSAAAWPDKPIRIIVPGQAGGSFDIIARMLGEELRPHLGNTQVAVDNRPGDTGEVAAAAAVEAKDDHTFLIMSDDFVTSSLASKSARFQPLRDVKTVSTVGEGALVFLAGPTAPFKTFAELVEYARANPGKLAYASVGEGSVSHLTARLAFADLKLDLKHVDSRGAGGVINDLIDGKLQLAVVGIGPASREVQSGKLKALAVSSPARIPAMQGAPTLVELGLPAFSIVNHAGIVAPPNTPDAVVDQFAKAIAAALTDEGLRKRFAENGATARSSTPAQYDAELLATSRFWKALIEERGLSVD
jgi:tripartite-type tricarboxylate transporter receptor subunit TctC